MRALIALVLWLVLAAWNLPLALLALLLWPVVWLALLPFRLLAAVVRGLFAFIGALFMLPARLLGAGR